MNDSIANSQLEVTLQTLQAVYLHAATGTLQMDILKERSGAATESALRFASQRISLHLGLPG
jgi:hypothetical protein